MSKSNSRDYIQRTRVDELPLSRNRCSEGDRQKSKNRGNKVGPQNGEDWYQRLLKTMNEGFSIRDENGLFSYVNDKFCEMSGYSRGELIGRPIQDFIDKADLLMLEEQLEKRRTGVRSTYELTWVRKDGRNLYTIISAAPLFDDKGNFRGGFGAMTDITLRKLVEKKVATYQKKLRSLASELSLTEERERRRIAAELHDRIGQTLAITKIKLGAFREATSSQSDVNDLDEISGLVEQTIRDTRSLTLELSPPILYELGLEAAVEWLTEQVQQQHHVRTRFEGDSRPKQLDEDVRVLLFKIVQELLFNVVKHAQASTAKVSVREEKCELRIIIEDDGVGFDTDQSKSQISQTGGFGLFSIGERLDHLGGYFEISSKPGNGTRVTVCVPLKTKECIQSNE
jgi:PAS domain S-box-containing protein